MIPEEYGGLGLGYVELVALMEKMGESPALRALLLERVPGGERAAGWPASEAQKQEHLPGIAEGRPWRPSRSPSRTGAGTPRGIEVCRPPRRRATTCCDGKQALRARRPLRGSADRGCTPRPGQLEGRGGREPLRGSGDMRRASSRKAAAHDGPDPPLRPRSSSNGAARAPLRRFMGEEGGALDRAGFRRRWIWPPWRSPPSRWAAPRSASTWRSTTRRSASSSGAPSARSRPSSTSART